MKKTPGKVKSKLVVVWEGGILGNLRGVVSGEGVAFLSKQPTTGGKNNITIW